MYIFLINLFLFIADDDFESAALTLFFSSGSRLASFTVDIVDDNVIEDLESFQCQLSAASSLFDVGFTFSTASSTVTIMDNDGTYTL